MDNKKDALLMCPKCKNQKFIEKMGGYVCSNDICRMFFSKAFYILDKKHEVKK